MLTENNDEITASEVLFECLNQKEYNSIGRVRFKSNVLIVNNTPRLIHYILNKSKNRWQQVGQQAFEDLIIQKYIQVTYTAFNQIFYHYEFKD